MRSFEKQLGLVAGVAFLILGGLVFTRFSKSVVTPANEDLSAFVSVNQGADSSGEVEAPQSSLSPEDFFRAFQNSQDYFSEDEFSALWDKYFGYYNGADLSSLAGISDDMSRFYGRSDLVLEKILGSFGPGSDRNYLVQSCFAMMKDASQARECYQRLKFADEISAAEKGLSQFLAKQMVDESGVNLLEATDLDFLGNRESKVFIQAIEQCFVHLEIEGATLEEKKRVLEDAINLSFTDAEKVALLASLAEVSDELPFLVWDTFGGLKLNDVDKAKLLITKRMFAENPREAIELLAFEEGNGREIGEGVNYWLRVDANAPMDWLTKNRSSLSPNVVDGFATGVAKFAVASNDFLAARTWLGEIADSATRRKVEGQIWEKELRAVTIEARRAPREMMESMINGNSQHQDYWLESVATEWMNSNPDEISDWYASVSEAISPLQNQYLAAAFAKEAIAQGDLSLAQQWASRIQDEKTLTRINGIIQEAEQAASN